VTAADLVAVHAGARRAWGWLPAVTRAGRVYQGPFGELLISRADGRLDPIHQGGRPHGGIGADPTAVGPSKP
jgi:hypothetical protein